MRPEERLDELIARELAGPEAARPSRWRGLNLLGFALMTVREQL